MSDPVKGGYSLDIGQQCVSSACVTSSLIPDVIGLKILALLMWVQ